MIEKVSRQLRAVLEHMEKNHDGPDDEIVDPNDRATTA